MNKSCVRRTPVYPRLATASCWNCGILQIGGGCRSVFIVPTGHADVTKSQVLRFDLLKFQGCLYLGVQNSRPSPANFAISNFTDGSASQNDPQILAEFDAPVQDRNRSLPRLRPR
jgi:hypothetical protein